MKLSHPKPISNAISSIIDQLGIGVKIKQYEVVNSWSKIVGEQIAKVSSAERMEGGKLFVRVSRSTWRNELLFLKKELISKINKTINQEIVKDIIFR